MATWWPVTMCNKGVSINWIASARFGEHEGPVDWPRWCEAVAWYGEKPDR